MLIKYNVSERIIKPVRNFLFLQCTGYTQTQVERSHINLSFTFRRKTTVYVYFFILFLVLFDLVCKRSKKSVAYDQKWNEERWFEMVYHRNIGQLMHNNWAAIKLYFQGDLLESVCYFLLSWKSVILPESDSFAPKTLKVTMVWYLSSYSYLATHLYRYIIINDSSRF